MTPLLLTTPRFVLFILHSALRHSHSAIRNSSCRPRFTDRDRRKKTRDGRSNGPRSTIRFLRFYDYQSHSIAPSISSNNPKPLEPLMTSFEPFMISFSGGTVQLSVTHHRRQMYIFALASVSVSVWVLAFVSVSVVVFVFVFDAPWA